MPRRVPSATPAGLALPLLIGLVALAGCRHTQTLMPTPTVFEGGNADPFAQVAEQERTTECEVFVFTDRRPSGEPEPDAFYSNDRNLDGLLAVATVRVGANMDWTRLYTESVERKRDRDPTIELLKIEEVGPLWTTVAPSPARFDPAPTADAEAKAPAEKFAAALNAKLARSRQKDAFIFIHGFNTKFHENLELAAELHHYLGREGVFVAYAWPSRDSLFSYSADKANAAYSTRMFRLFLDYLARETEARRIHILAHSAGNPIAVNALRQLRLVNHERDAQAVRDRYRIGQVVLAAPDMDLLQFRNAWFDGFYEIAERVTLYDSTSDRALELSAWLYGDTRLGRSLDALGPSTLGSLAQSANLELVSVAAAEKNHGSWLGHSYFHQDPWVSSDLMMLLRYGAGAKDRGLVRKDGDPVWSFPEDYKERVQAIAAAAAGTAADRANAAGK